MCESAAASSRAERVGCGVKVCLGDWVAFLYRVIKEWGCWGNLNIFLFVLEEELKGDGRWRGVCLNIGCLLSRLATKRL